MGERKITLDQARQSGAVGITIYCASEPVAAGGCRHVGAMGTDAAIRRWGGERRLDELPLVCSACGGRSVDVRPLFDNAPRSAEAPASRLLDAWRSRPPGARR